MPNGGIPLHMILKPKDGDVVLYCYGGKLQVFRSADWRPRQGNGDPIVTLTEEEARALVRFMRYWLGSDDPPNYERNSRRRLRTGEPPNDDPERDEPVYVVYDF